MTPISIKVNRDVGDACVDLFNQRRVYFDGDLGANLAMSEYHFDAPLLYHTNKSVTTGVGFDLKPVRMLFSYTSNYGPLGAYADNTFEFGLR